jgi:hypothetical protein
VRKEALGLKEVERISCRKVKESSVMIRKLKESRQEKQLTQTD